MDVTAIRKWFFKNRRNLPWRENPSPYEVWVSEIMLQQTQVSVVVPYFERWMNIFPTIEKLADAPLEKVIKAWEGLGYYSRARNLHEGAKYLMEENGGELPSSAAELEKVKGVGPYTVGAILSFAYKEKSAAVDGNVLRVLARYYGIEESIDQGKVQKMLRDKCQDLLPENEPWIIMEGLIELGALVCKKKADCTVCPLKDGCVAHRDCKAHLLPLKNKRQKTTHLYRDVAVIYTSSAILIKDAGKTGIMSDLFEFPYFEKGVLIEEVLGLSLTPEIPLPEVTHGFTRYKAFLSPHLYRAEEKEIKGYSWIPFKKIKTLPFSSGHKRILSALLATHLKPLLNSVSQSIP